MKRVIQLVVLSVCGLGSALGQELSQQDAIRIREFYRLAAAVQDKVWPNWSQVPAPLLLVTEQNEFLTHYPDAPKGFTKISADVLARPRQFPANLQATFPAFGPTPVIVIGEPENTASKTSTPWLITVMHEHFHQLQDSQPRYFEKVDQLGLSRGDNTGMWMLNYPFPYDKVSASFGNLRDLLSAALAEPDAQKFTNAARKYIAARKQFFAQLSPDDHKYLAFQLWYEGIARYTQVKVAEAAADYRPSSEYAGIPDFESFAGYATKAKKDSLDELRTADISKLKRLVVYPWGAGEGLLLDRFRPGWQDQYFAHPLTLDYLFE
jgi:hypothetical protein